MWSAINSIFWVEVKSFHVRGSSQVLNCMPSVWGLEQCSILCMHWNGPRTFLDSFNFDWLKELKVRRSNRSERSVGILWWVGVGTFLQLHIGVVPPLVLEENNAFGFPGPWKSQGSAGVLDKFLMELDFYRFLRERIIAYIENSFQIQIYYCQIVMHCMWPYVWNTLELWMMRLNNWKCQVLER